MPFAQQLAIFDINWNGNLLFVFCYYCIKSKFFGLFFCFVFCLMCFFFLECLWVFEIPISKSSKLLQLGVNSSISYFSFSFNFFCPNSSWLLWNYKITAFITFMSDWKKSIIFQCFFLRYTRFYIARLSTSLIHCREFSKICPDASCCRKNSRLK